METHKDIYYRPEWTCGRYNAAHEVAIYYNLLDGMSYFFESYSALVVSKLLEAPRNHPVSISDIANSTSISEESIKPFMKSLSGLGLILSHIPTGQEMSDYRRQLSNLKIQQSQATTKTTKEKLPMDVSTAEMDYADKAGGVTNVMFELTYRCSEQCIHCYNIGATRNDMEISHRGDLEELNLTDYKRIIDELYNEGLTKVCLSGGDPFAKNIAWDIIDYLYKKEIAIDIFTNGQSIVNDVERLIKYYPRLVGVSIYSGSPSTHDRITRVKGSWERSVSVVEQLSKTGTPIVLKCCVMRPNVQDYYTVMNIAKRYGAMVQFELNVTDSIDGDKCASHFLRLTPEMLDVVLQDDNTPMYVGKEAPNYGGQTRNMNVNGCGAGVNSFCITPNGEFIPCCAFHLSFGNLRNSSLKEILNKNDLLLNWQNLTLEQYEECGRYDYCAYCNLCPGNNFSEHGDPRKAGENNCYMAKCRWQLAKRLMQGEPPINKDEQKERLAQFSHFDEKIKRLLN